MFSLTDYTYTLPEDLIAQSAMQPHHDARMMMIDRETGELIEESTFWNIDTFLGDDRVIFFNNSRVIPARIRLEGIHYEEKTGKKGILESGEILFCQKKSDASFEALVRPGKRFKIGTRFFFPEGIIEVKDITEEGRILSSEGCDISELMERYGELPLPPYITYTKEKEKDYQTAFAKENGSVAAPTASLHFTRELLEKIQNEKYYVTLHVGLGTFRGIDTADIREYQIHSETVEIEISLFETIAKLKNEGKKIVAVGTTVCRTLESLPYLWRKLEKSLRESYSISVQEFWDTISQINHMKRSSRHIDTKGDILLGEGEQDFSHTRNDGEYRTGKSKNPISEIHITESSIFFETTIYIYPSQDFALVDDIVTNFHLSESSLLVLISAFIGKGKILKIYEKAIEKCYRFFSFGDGMYIRASEKKDVET